MPSSFRFGDPDEAKRSLQAAGFTDVQAVVLPLVWQLPQPEAMLDVMQRATVRTPGILRAQTPEALAAIRAAVTNEAVTYATATGIAVPMGAALTSGRKSAATPYVRRRDGIQF